jgi:hypothetical protein
VKRDEIGREFRDLADDADPALIGKVSKFAARISLAVWHAGALNPLGSAGELGCGVIRKRAQIEQPAGLEPVGKAP